MIAVDTNILVYAHRRDSPWFATANGIVAALAQGESRWAIPWPCVHEFVAVVTNGRAFPDATRAEDALQQVDHWMASPSLRLLGEAPGYWGKLKQILGAGKISGPMVHDAHIAAICLENGVSEFWTADRDFSRMPGLKLRNPLLQV